MAPGILLSAPGIIAFLGYTFTWLISGVLYTRLSLYTAHMIVLFVIYAASVLAPFTSVLALGAVVVLGLARRLVGRRFWTSVLLVTVSFAGAILMGLALDGQITIPGALE
jgi:hypothetical protein